MASQKEVIKLKGKVVEALPNTQFKVELENGLSIIAISAARCASIISVWFQAIPWK